MDMVEPHGYGGAHTHLPKSSSSCETVCRAQRGRLSTGSALQTRCWLHLWNATQQILHGEHLHGGLRKAINAAARSAQSRLSIILPLKFFVTGMHKMNRIVYLFFFLAPCEFLAMPCSDQAHLNHGLVSHAFGVWDAFQFTKAVKSDLNYHGLPAVMCRTQGLYTRYDQCVRGIQELGCTVSEREPQGDKNRAWNGTCSPEHQFNRIQYLAIYAVVA